MITNISTIKQWDICRRRVLHSHHYNRTYERGTALAIGTSFHNALAVGLANNDWDAAQAHVRTHAQAEILPTLDEFEHFRAQEYEDITSAMVEAYRKGYEPIADLWRVVQPEAQFCVPIPDSHHNCLALHHYINDGRGNIKEVRGGGFPTGEDISRCTVLPAHDYPDPTCFCWQPHYLAGRTDAVVINAGRIWLYEHKTTSSLTNVWWHQWTLDKQPTAYLYGLWRTTGQLPAGFVLNAVRKPTEAQVAEWNKRRKDHTQDKSVADYITFERRQFTRTEADLLRFERQMRHSLNEWERAMIGGPDYFEQQMVSGNCTQFNHICDWAPVCAEADSTIAEHTLTTSFAPRDRNYIDVYLDELTKKVLN